MTDDGDIDRGSEPGGTGATEGSRTSTESLPENPVRYRVAGWPDPSELVRIKGSFILPIAFALDKTLSLREYSMDKKRGNLACVGILIAVVGLCLLFAATLPGQLWLVPWGGFVLILGCVFAVWEVVC